MPYHDILRQTLQLNFCQRSCSGTKCRPGPSQEEELVCVRSLYCNKTVTFFFETLESAGAISECQSLNVLQKSKFVCLWSTIVCQISSDNLLPTSTIDTNTIRPPTLTHQKHTRPCENSARVGEVSKFS